MYRHKDHGEYNRGNADTHILLHEPYCKMSVDKEIVITSSFIFTKAAEEKNVEN